MYLPLVNNKRFLQLTVSIFLLYFTRRNGISLACVLRRLAFTFLYFIKFCSSNFLILRLLRLEFEQQRRKAKSTQTTKFTLQLMSNTLAFFLFRGRAKRGKTSDRRMAKFSSINCYEQKFKMVKKLQGRYAILTADIQNAGLFKVNKQRERTRERENEIKWLKLEKSENKILTQRWLIGREMAFERFLYICFRIFRAVLRS